MLAVARPLAAAVLMATAMLAVTALASPFAELVAQLAAGGLVYAVTLRVVGRESFDEVLGFTHALLPRRFRWQRTMA